MRASRCSFVSTLSVWLVCVVGVCGVRPWPAANTADRTISDAMKVRVMPVASRCYVWRSLPVRGESRQGRVLPWSRECSALSRPRAPARPNANRTLPSTRPVRGDVPRCTSRHGLRCVSVPWRRDRWWNRRTECRQSSGGGRRTNSLSLLRLSHGAVRIAADEIRRVVRVSLPGVHGHLRGRGQARSNRSRLMTLSHAATKSRTNFACESLHA